MPAVALGYYAAPAFMRLIRAGMIEVLGADYIRTARAKGLRERTVVMRHALKNALIPVVTLVGIQIGAIIATFIYFGAKIARLFRAWVRGLTSAEARADKDYTLAWAVIVGSLPVGVVGFLARNLDDRHAESLEQLVDARELRREVVRHLLARRLVVGETLVAEGPLARVEHHPQVVGLPLV